MGLVVLLRLMLDLVVLVVLEDLFLNQKGLKDLVDLVVPGLLHPVVLEVLVVLLRLK